MDDLRGRTRDYKRKKRWQWKIAEGKGRRRESMTKILGEVMKEKREKGRGG